jgi:hypothetical protein
MGTNKKSKAAEVTDSNPSAPSAKQAKGLEAGLVAKKTEGIKKQQPQ